MDHNSGNHKDHIVYVANRKTTVHSMSEVKKFFRCVLLFKGTHGCNVLN